MKNLAHFFSAAIAGKKVLITGGSTGIGREIALALTSLGADCIICGRHMEQLQETVAAASLTDAGKCIPVICDVAEEADVEKLFAEVDSSLGGIDILINNAALAYGSIAEGSYSDWSYVVKTNLMGNLSPIHHAIPRMKEKGSGHIVNIGSMSALSKDEGSSVYVATKSGLQGFSEALRKEVNKLGIKVSLIEPGAVDTDMQEGSAEEKLEKIDKQEMLKAEDIALATVFCLAQPQRTDIVSLQVRPHLQKN
jgi:NADP-dependent 3-hydroxy acid dehydrogenase YdfG